MPVNTPSADVCTPKRPRRARQPKLPYPAHPEPGIASRTEYWLIAVQRDEAQLAAMRLHAQYLHGTRLAKNAPLMDGIYAAIRLLAGELEESQQYLQKALELKSAAVQVPA